MKAFQKILVPVDFSKPSGEALATAAGLSQRYGAALTLVHVFEPIAYALPDGYMLFNEPQLSLMFEEFEKSLAADKRSAEQAGAASVQTQLLRGAPAHEICECAARGGYDLIVMGTHGRKGLSRAVLGSVAERVVRLAACPVLTVPAPA